MANWSGFKQIIETLNHFTLCPLIAVIDTPMKSLTPRLSMAFSSQDKSPWARERDQTSNLRKFAHDEPFTCRQSR